jgi:hypothetical protein
MYKYIKVKELVNNLIVINDIAKRGVKLIEDYSKLIIKSEDQKQYLLQVVSIVGDSQIIKNHLVQDL